MKILAISDVHGDLERTKRLVKMVDSVKPDVIVVAGDLTQFGPKSTAKKVISELEKSNCKILAIMGNNDTKEVGDELKHSGHDMHNKALEIEHIGFVGFHGPNSIRLGGMQVLNYDPVHYKLRDLASCDKRVMISHLPPYNTSLDKLFSGQHVGSEFLRETVENEQPDLVICGHIHEGRGTEKIGSTLMVNTGAFCDGYAALIDMDGREPKVEFLQIK